MVYNSYTGEFANYNSETLTYAKLNVNGEHLPFYFIDGMTWGEYVNSPYNHLNFRISSEPSVYPGSGQSILNDLLSNKYVTCTGVYVFDTHKIAKLTIHNYTQGSHSGGSSD